MIRFLVHIIFLMLGLLPLLNSCGNANEVVSPNIVLVLTDDQGWGDVSYQGNEVIETPAIDLLSNKGVVINRFYVSPVCAPTRASLLTGKDHLSTGTSWVTHRKEVMREAETTIAEILKDEGYSTACFGKWHNGSQFPHNANGQGFETFFGFSAGHLNNYFDTQLEYNGQTVPTQGYVADVLTDSVLNYISREHDSPFFAYVAYNTPHTPYQVEDKFFNKYKKQGLDNKTACIYGMCENIDFNVGRIINHLEEEKLTDNTIFIFLSDNGPNFERFNGGLKGRKAQVDEGGVRVPFIIYYPNGNIENRIIEKEFGAHIDILPTILDICGITQSELELDGLSLKNLLDGSKTELEDRTHFTHHVIREMNEVPGAIRTKEFLLTLNPHDTSLYNLLEDPNQSKDLSDSLPGIMNKMAAEYHEWFTQTTANGVVPEAIQIGHANYPDTELPAQEAEISNGAIFYGKDGWANDWCVLPGTMKWDVNIISAAKYAVKAQITVPQITSDTKITLKTISQSIDCEITKPVKAPHVKSFDRVKRGEVYERKWETIELSELILDENDNSIALEFYSSAEEVVEIKSLIVTKL